MQRHRHTCEDDDNDAAALHAFSTHLHYVCALVGCEIVLLLRSSREDLIGLSLVGCEIAVLLLSCSSIRGCRRTCRVSVRRVTVLGVGASGETESKRKVHDRSDATSIVSCGGEESGRTRRSVVYSTV